MVAVNLSASTYFVPDSTSMQYLNYGAAVSEVKTSNAIATHFSFPLCSFVSFIYFLFYTTPHRALLLALHAQYFTVAYA